MARAQAADRPRRRAIADFGFAAQQLRQGDQKGVAIDRQQWLASLDHGGVLRIRKGEWPRHQSSPKRAPDAPVFRLERSLAAGGDPEMADHPGAKATQ